MKLLTAIASGLAISGSLSSLGITAARSGAPDAGAEVFKQCMWNGNVTTCQVTPIQNGIDILWASGGEQRIIYGEGNKVWVIHDGIKEPGTIEGRTITRLSDNIQFSF